MLSWRSVKTVLGTILLPKPLAAFPHKHRRNNGQPLERERERGRQTEQERERERERERGGVDPVTMTIINRKEYWPSRRFEPATPSSQVFYATGVVTGARPIYMYKTQQWQKVSTMTTFANHTYTQSDLALDFSLFHQFWSTEPNRIPYKTLTVPLATTGLFCGECRARSTCTYVQSDLALHSPLVYFCQLNTIESFLTYFTLFQNDKF